MLSNGRRPPGVPPSALADTLLERLTAAYGAAADPERAADILWTALHGLVSLHLAERIDRRVAGRAFLDAAIAQAQAPFASPG